MTRFIANYIITPDFETQSWLLMSNRIVSMAGKKLNTIIPLTKELPNVKFLGRIVVMLPQSFVSSQLESQIDQILNTTDDPKEIVNSLTLACPITEIKPKNSYILLLKH